MIALIEDGGAAGGAAATLESRGPNQLWRRIRWHGVVVLTSELGWGWRKLAGRHPRLVLVSPRGVEWEFRLRRGAWIKKRKGQSDG